MIVMHIYYCIYKRPYQLQHKQEIIQIMRIVLKYYVPFADFLSKIKNTQIDNAKDIDVVMPMYILIEHLFKNIRNFMAIGKR